MPPQRQHDKIISAAAKPALASLGFKRKGSSRLWFADRGVWLSLVEFQPSGWSKGSYLNVAAHFLWSPMRWSFNYSPDTSLRTFIEYESDIQFVPLAAQQAADAVRGSELLLRQFRDFPAMAAVLLDQSKAGRPGGWPDYDAGVACGLCGDADKAMVLFQQTLDSFADSASGRQFTPDIERLLALVSDTDGFRDYLRQRVNAARRELGLPELAGL